MLPELRAMMRGDWMHDAMEYRDIDREAQRRAEDVIDRIVKRNAALWRALDVNLPPSERLAALDEAFR
jgi:hypothetical protein